MCDTKLKIMGWEVGGGMGGVEGEVMGWEVQGLPNPQMLSPGQLRAVATPCIIHA